MSADPRNQVVSTFHLRRRTPGSFLLVPCPPALWPVSDRATAPTEGLPDSPET